MSAYEQRLDEFAEGKRLVRLSKPVRDRADAKCDACGSIQPRTLYGQKDEDSGRYYFVGDQCLKELVKRGAILRRFGRESGPAAYERERGLRAQELSDERTGDGADSKFPTPASQISDVTDRAVQKPESEGSVTFPVVLVLETSDHFEAFICNFTSVGALSSWGHTQEAKYEKVLSRVGEKGIILERVKQERTDALELCVSKAWNSASARHSGSKRSQLPANGADDEYRGQGLPQRILSTLQLLASNRIAQPSSPAEKNGVQNTDSTLVPNGH